MSARLKRQRNDEAQGREIVVMLVGVGIHPGLERMNEFPAASASRQALPDRLLSARVDAHAALDAPWLRRNVWV